MSAEEQTGVGVVAVPNSQVEAVRKYAASILNEDTPDIEGYAAMIRGIGLSGDISRGGILMADAPCGTSCTIDKGTKDFACGDPDA
jgi:hypothetical protein